MDYKTCNLCPRECGADRTAGELGFCGCPGEALVAKTMLHKWEEPALAGKVGSGAIFFGGCTLKCSYCQNRAISAAPVGKAMDSAELRREMENLIAQGAENIDLVTPTQFLPTILPALSPQLPVPVVYNCGGYEKAETIAKLDGLVDIYLPDMKYADDALARSFSAAEDYFAVASRAIQEMVHQVGAPQWEGERIKKGVIIRHLILPGYVENSLKVLDWIGDTFAPGQVLVSLMRQYTPMPGMPAPFDRKITDEEYDAVLSWMYLNGLEGFTQEAASGDAAYIPKWSL
ncbi:MAG: 4Fe-4S cluster-binding domain-containing protein [Oscillospiraceae bacterium]|nr:4Fe-4S cluster-binding domain-containing protein [Oscillospiraceae bacterium]